MDELIIFDISRYLCVLGEDVGISLDLHFI